MLAIYIEAMFLKRNNINSKTGLKTNLCEILKA